MRLRQPSSSLTNRSPLLNYLSQSEEATRRRQMELEDESALRGLMRKRNYVDLECRGMYDQRILTQLERICEDCYNLYKDPEVHQFCR